MTIKKYLENVGKTLNDFPNKIKLISTIIDLEKKELTVSEIMRMSIYEYQNNRARDLYNELRELEREIVELGEV